MFNKIKSFLTSKRTLVVLSSSARFLALFLAMYLIVQLTPLITNSVNDGGFTQGLIISAAAVTLAFFFVVRPMLQTIAVEKMKREAAQQQQTNEVVDFSSLSTRASALHIPNTVPSGLRESVIWEAEMSGDVSKSGVEAAAKMVVDRARDGVPVDQVPEILAIHESGHATVALALGRAVVGIRRDQKAGHTYSGATYSLNAIGSPTSEDLWNDMVLTVAGTQAEQLWFPKWLNKFPTNGHDDRSDAMGYVTILAFNGWSPREDVPSTMDALLRFAQLEARRILTENQDMFDELVSLVKAQPVINAAEILEIAKKHKTAK